eukprot:Clim_evm34s44 gene=Clim_evmTU34s44
MDVYKEVHRSLADNVEYILCSKSTSSDLVHLWIFGIVLSIWGAVVMCVVVYIYYKVIYGSPGWLAGKSVLVTGGAAGIGLEMVHAFDRFGCSRIHVWDNNEEAVLRLQRMSRLPNGAELHVSIVDVGNRDEVAKASQDVREIERTHAQGSSSSTSKNNDFGPDVIVNNAAIAVIAPFLEQTPEAVRKTFEVNAMAPFFVLQEFLGALIKKKPHAGGEGFIVNMGSVLGFMSFARLTSYSATKAAVCNMHESLMMELSDYPGVGHLLVAPATVRSRMFHGAADMPFFRKIEAQDVAELIAWHIDRRVSGTLPIPLIMYTIPIWRSFPWHLRRFIANLVGANRALVRVKGNVGAENHAGNVRHHLKTN